MSDLTQARLKELLEYDPDTGLFRWRTARPNGVKPGQFAGSKQLQGYIHIWVDGVPHKAHRVAWLYVYGELPSTDIGHIDGNRANNRIGNLRQTNNSQNIANSKRRVDNTSGIKGVSFFAPRQRWRARIRHQGRPIFLGHFATPEEAAAAYKAAAIKYFAEFARIE